MTGKPLTDPTAEIAVGARRAEVLTRLREAQGPLSVPEIATQTGLHVNTARFHLDALVADGLAERTAEERMTPGRPRMLYTARSQTPGPRSFALLAEMLTGLVVSLNGAGAPAVEAGRAWGRHLVEAPPPTQQVDAGQATERLHQVLDAVGFQPETRIVPEGVELRLHHCPFLQVAERHTDVVCAIHLGLMQGALAELRAPLRADALDPLVTPHLCLGLLRPAPVGRDGG
jgi:predicted ArsR family transcriptional regulator